LPSRAPSPRAITSTSPSCATCCPSGFWPGSTSSGAWSPQWSSRC